MGKLHQKLETYCHATVCSSLKQFDKAIDDVSFLDFHVLSPTTAIVVKDGLIIKSHSNIPSISARYYNHQKKLVIKYLPLLNNLLPLLIHLIFFLRVYSHSKLLMWKLWFHTASRMGYFSDDAALRLNLTDTDSLHLSCQRIRSDIENTEIRILLDNNETIHYSKTLHAYRFSTMYLKTFAHLLDYSSLNEVD